MANYEGTARNDYYAGTSGIDVISGNGGNDYLLGAGNHDRIVGGSGNDYLGGGSGDDYNSGAWTATADPGGDDVIDGGEGIDRAGFYHQQAELGGVIVSLYYGSQRQVIGLQDSVVELIGIEHLSGTPFADSLSGDDESNRLWGSPATYIDGVTVSSTNNDVLQGYGGDDILTVGIGNHHLIGGSGWDTVSFTENGAAESALTISLELQDSDQDTGNGRWRLSGIENLSGSVEDDRLTGNAGGNVLAGELGSDILSGGEGNDLLLGDGLIEIDSHGTGYSGPITTFYVSDQIGHDVLDGGLGADEMIGGLGDDRYIVDNDGDIVNEFMGDGDDTVESSISYKLGADIENLALTGAAAIDATGNAAANRIDGNAAANILDGQAGADRMDGGGGNDRYFADNIGDMASETQLGGGIDTVESSATFTLGANIENLRLTGSGRVNGTGNDIANLIFGNAAGNELNGGAGNDRIDGGGGDDRLDGGTGGDRMVGGAGNDRYIVDTSSDAVTESAAAAGTDTVESSVSYRLGANLENLRLSGAAFANGTGNDLANLLFGNAGANVLNGAGGADRVDGGAGNDRFIVDNAGDIAIERDPSGGIDTVESSVAFTLGTNIENLRLLGSAWINATGNALANLIFGNSGSNVLDGAGGADRMDGGAGNDRYIVDNVRDVAIETSASGGVDTVESRVSHALGSNVENLRLVGGGAVDGTGNGLANLIFGNGAANVLDGAGGADRMDGGNGNDRYMIDNAADVAIESNAAGGIDTVESRVSHTLGANIENLRLAGTAAVNGTGNGLDNLMFGNGAANVLKGAAGADRIEGGAGADKLHGGAGHDSLRGGSGADGFYFDTALSAATNIDKILDFAVADDTIFLDRAVFSRLAGAGTLNAADFVSGTAAADASDRIIYDRAGGNILYDPDGSGAAAAVLFAQVTAGTLLTHLDFVA